jgi:hypothetical protein
LLDHLHESSRDTLPLAFVCNCDPVHDDIRLVGQPSAFQCIVRRFSCVNNRCIGDDRSVSLAENVPDSSFDIFLDVFRAGIVPAPLALPLPEHLLHGLLQDDPDAGDVFSGRFSDE